MAPDASSVKAGQKLGLVKHWQNLGQSAEALWGECQGSALYQVRVDLSTLSIQCSCPSRKQPCKHGLGLLLLTANTPEAVPVSDPPEWIISWLAKRAAVSKRKETLKAKTNAEPSVSQTKTAEKRQAQVAAGIARLDLWLNDLVRNGLGNLASQPATFWEQQAKQMVDAQASGLAARIRRMAAIPNASPDWPERLLSHCGELALLTHSYQHIDQLAPALQEDVRQLVGWTRKEDEVLATGEQVKDTWIFLGQATEPIERGNAQRTWLLGTQSKRPALLLQFSIAGSSYPDHYPLGARQQLELAYWPGSAPQRALIATRHGSTTPQQTRLPGVSTFHAFLRDVTAILARQPWQERFLCTLCDAIPQYDAASNQWWLRDSEGLALPLTQGEHWLLLSLSGGHPIDFAGEWNGETLLPLGVLADGAYHVLLKEEEA